MHTPIAPAVSHWPQTLKSAAALLGTLTTCGPGFRPAAWPPTPATRCAALTEYLTPRFVAIGMTAAWIWGAARERRTPLELSTRSGRVPSTSENRLVAYRQFKFRSEDVAYFGEYAVTHPTRTAYDLMRSADNFDTPRRVACRLLIAPDHNAVEKLLVQASRASRTDRARVSLRLRECYGS
ncbi:MAG: hypothetical protein ACTIJ6_02560 [Leucobacter sp.]